VKVVLASGNRGKLNELTRLLADIGFELISQDQLGITPAPEDGLTFIENALGKARHASAVSKLPAIADDSGIVVDALNGAPGIHSARYAGGNRDDKANNRKLVAALENESNRDAHFYCAIVFLRHVSDPAPIVATGSWYGEIIDQPRGSDGFGYDPHFLLPDRGVTAAELDAEEKDRLSHRGQAVRGFLEQFQ